MYLQKHSQPPVSLHGQLLWREFFYTVATGTPNFDKMEGNPVCTQIDWDTKPEFLEAWKMVRNYDGTLCKFFTFFAHLSTKCSG